MPRGNQTGPMGMGPMTGRGAGFCAGYSVPGFMNSGGGRGFRRGSLGGGFQGGGQGGRGHRHCFYATGLTGFERAQMGWPMVQPAFRNMPETCTATIGKEQNLEALKNQAAFFEQRLNGIKAQIEQVESSEKSENNG